MPVLIVKQLDETLLFKRLAAFTGADDAGNYAGQVRGLCAEAAARLKQFPALHTQFTLHDEVHCLRVVVLMGELIGPLVDRLNEVELALLILSAYFHDQGMIADADELTVLRASDGWRDHVAQWSAEHPNRAETMQRLSDPLLGDAERVEAVRAAADLEAAMFTDFIRVRHGTRSAEFVMSRYGEDPRMIFQGRHLARLLAAICQSHVLPTSDLTTGGSLRTDELVGTARVNTVLLAYVLRLADILDFDRDRTPDPLYRAITFSSGVSLLEWEKHRSIVGWEISPERIAFSAECSHPAYERAIRQFIGWIDAELADAREWSRTLPQVLEGHRLRLPASVDASHVGARVDPVTRRPDYIYRDLEFTLARDELVKLLMTDNLYEQRGLFVRELMQNALDALRHRQALFRLGGSEAPSMEVTLEHFQDTAGFDVVRCADSGVGMDLSVVTQFLTRVGRSFYRSPEFERERARFQHAGCDFDPCARFGIGFMSCFMFGDEIMIRTRRDYGAGQAWGDPLVVHITGLSGIITIRPGKADQPIGTLVEVRSRRRSFIVDEWDDPVWLLKVVEGYAIATEFPIAAICTVPGIEGSVSVPTTFSAHRHPLEQIDISGKHVFRVDMAVADARLGGEMRLCTLVDGDGLVTIENADARVQWEQDRSPSSEKGEFFVECTNGGPRVNLAGRTENSQICADGILVAGRPGRALERDSHLGMRYPQMRFGGASYLIDARGSIKPTLTPARTPPNRSHSREHTWRRLERAAGAAYGRLLEDVLDRCAPEKDPLRFWVVAAAYSLDVTLLPLDTLWNRVRVPVQAADGTTMWRALWEIGPVHLSFADATNRESYQGDDHSASKWQLKVSDGATLRHPGEVEASTGWRLDPQSESWRIRHLIVACSVASVLSPNELRLTPLPPGHWCLNDTIVGQGPSVLHSLRFVEGQSNILRVAGGSRFLNSSSVVVAQSREFLETDRDALPPLQLFLRTLLWAWPPIRSTDPVQPDSWHARTREKLAELFTAVDWKTVGAALRPPYHAFAPGIGIIQVTAEDLQSWRRRGT